ncbi:MAG: hypothetical protein COB83_04010 [Gammaproteobacteria bacterium]|nr:MAG: hypothetical protein COB83_04010 [Gammaproteobacteria bacterium]
MEAQQKLTEVQVETPIIEETSKQDFLAPETANNNHYLILGKSGEGKTVLTKRILTQLANKDSTACFHVIDLHGEYSELFTKECTWSSVERGFPFDWLKKTTDLPWDIHVDQKLCEIIEATNLGPVQLGDLRKLLLRCKKDITNKELALVLRKHLSQSSQFHLDPLILLLRENTNIKSPYGRSVLHDLSHLSNKVSQSIYVISLFRQIFIQAKFSNDSIPHFLILEEASRLIKAETTMDMLWQEGRKFNINGVFIAQSWTLPKSVKQNSATMLLFPSAASAIPDSTNLTDFQNYARPVFKFDGSNGEWLETQISENKNQATVIDSPLNFPHQAQEINEKHHDGQHELKLTKISEAVDECTEPAEEVVDNKDNTQENSNDIKNTCEPNKVHDSESLDQPSDNSFYRAKWTALIISIIGVGSCLAISISKVVV